MTERLAVIDMEFNLQKGITTKKFLYFTLVFCLLLLVLIVLVALVHGENNYNSFTEPVLELADGWTLTSSDGSSREITLPQTIDYGADGIYTLTNILPVDESLIVSPVFRFYSNYVDINIALDGQQLYTYPSAKAVFSDATGNTYHFIRLPVDYAGKTITIKIHCQMGERITYLLNPPLLGAKATMLRTDVMGSLPSIVLAGCMLVLAIGLSVLHVSFRRRLQLGTGTLYTAVFALLFACYVYSETIFAQVFTANGYLLCFCTLMLLALMPIPLMGIFAEEVSSRYKTVAIWLMLFCSANLLTQTFLNCAGILSFRVLLPATHFVIIVSITVMALCLFLSDRKEKPFARRKLLMALPMIAGGTADIILICLERPSFNNSFWFTVGVTLFIVLQFGAFVRNYFALYYVALETELLRDMAYQDVLTDSGNRNAYERQLKELSRGQLTERLCCLVVDINDLKLINDTMGHQAGDIAIMETAGLLHKQLPECASCFRTGGDEFIVLMNGFDKKNIQALVEELFAEAYQRGKACEVPLSVAIGYGFYEPGDGNINDFIRRVDANMYECKRRIKESPTYPFRRLQPRK